jgi:hypothetical protein
MFDDEIHRGVAIMAAGDFVDGRVCAEDASISSLWRSGFLREAGILGLCRRKEFDGCDRSSLGFL